MIQCFLTENRKQVGYIAVAVICIMTGSFIVGYSEGTVCRFKGNSKLSAEKYVYTNCHQMANGFIVAQDGRVRGVVRADDTNIDRIIAVITEYDIDETGKLITWLIEFKNKDYSNAVNFHNYCWNMLDGEVGWAVELKEQYR